MTLFHCAANIMECYIIRNNVMKLTYILGEGFVISALIYNHELLLRGLFKVKKT